MKKTNIRWLNDQLPDLIEQDVITDDVADSLRDHYKMSELEQAQSLSIMTIILASIGALFVGGGIILIFAHNWETLGKTTRTILAFAPLVIAQALLISAFYPKQRSRAWHEVCGVLVFCSVASSIAIIGQTYHISNDTQAFLTWWFVLVAPLVFILRAHLMSVLMMILGTALCMQYDSPYWLCLLVLIGYYLKVNFSGNQLLRSQTGWLLGICFGFCMASIGRIPDSSGLSIMLMMSISVATYLLGYLIEPNNRFWSRPLTNIGAVGIAGFTIALTFRDLLNDISPLFSKGSIDALSMLTWHQTLFFASLMVLSISLIIFNIARKRFESLPLASLFLIYLLFLILLPERSHAAFSYFAWAIVFSLILLGIGIWYVYLGVTRDSTSQLNFGLILMMSLVLMKFFDQDFSLISRGIVFIVIGLVFIGVNIWHSRRKKS
ncbi:MAG: DUF2157 domain-containing protein [Acidiferrobacterales bacterium]|nr:DUF2157 domain-containing protein [Acidiferrobacterales bacterium]